MHFKLSRRRWRLPERKSIDLEFRAAVSSDICSQIMIRKHGIKILPNDAQKGSSNDQTHIAEEDGMEANNVFVWLP